MFVAALLVLAAQAALAQSGNQRFLTGETVSVPADAGIILANGSGIEAASTDRTRNLHPSLRRLVEARGRNVADLQAASGLPAPLLDGDRVLVEIRFGQAQRMTGAVRGLGGTVRHARNGGIVEAWMPIAGLEALAAREDVARVWPAMLVDPQEGSALTQGLAAGQAGPWHEGGLDGSGVTVAIIDSFDDSGSAVAKLQASDDWPPPGQVTKVKSDSHRLHLHRLGRALRQHHGRPDRYGAVRNQHLYADLHSRRQWLDHRR